MGRHGRGRHGAGGARRVGCARELLGDDPSSAAPSRPDDGIRRAGDRRWCRPGAGDHADATSDGGPDAADGARSLAARRAQSPGPARRRLMPRPQNTVSAPGSFSRLTGRRSRSSWIVVVAQLRQQAEVDLARDLDRAQRAQVRRRVLHLEQAGARLDQAGGEVDERDLGGVGRAVEHRLAAEHAADEHAVDAADQALAVPDLDAVGVAEPVQLAVGGRQLVADPGARLAGARLAAALDDRREVLVERRLVAAAAQRAGERARDVDAVEREHAAARRAEPRHRVDRVVRPREDAAPVGVDERRRLEVGADADEAVLVARHRVRKRPAARRQTSSGARVRRRAVSPPRA